MRALTQICLFTHAVDLDKISVNPCEGMKSLYSNNRADIIWTDENLAAFKATAPVEVWWIVNAAARTGLRAGDLKRLAWSHVGPEAIEIPTDKSRGLRAAFVPIYDDLRAALAEVDKRSPIVLTNTLHQPWKAGANGSSFEKVRDAALPERDLHFHDPPGTAATRFHLAGLSNRDIAEIMAWDEASVEKIIRRHVGRKAVIAGIIKRLNQTEGRT